MKVMSTTNIDQLLSRRVAKILPSKEEFEKLLKTKKRIRLYQGFDPTGGRLHLGHTIGLRKLMDFARAGHEAIILFGTGTVLVGDPSERDTGRKLITQEEIDANIKGWKDQIAPLVDFDLVTIKQNGDWLVPLTLKDIIHIASNISAIQLFKRKSFTRRIKQGDTVWYHETMYPLLQGYDSVVLDVDLEIGGTDQEFNMLVGRELQHKINHRNKFVLTVPMILGTDGKQMSKTSGNCVWLDDSAEDMFGKIMSIPDKQIPSYWELLTDLPLKSKSELLTHPFEAKKELAFDITKQFHGLQAAKQAQLHFEKTVQNKEIPTNIPEIKLPKTPLSIIEVLKQANLGVSNSRIKQVIKQGGVSFNNKRITNPNQTITPKSGDIIKFGKRTFRKVNL